MAAVVPDVWDGSGGRSHGGGRVGRRERGQRWSRACGMVVEDVLVILGTWEVDKVVVVVPGVWDGGGGCGHGGGRVGWRERGRRWSWACGMAVK
jgi:hypothetical protein